MDLLDPPIYFELNDDQGIEHSHLRNPVTGEEFENPRAGELAPLNNIGFQISVERPVMRDDSGVDVITTTARVAIVPAERLDEKLHARILPGTRIVEVAHPAVANALIETGHYHRIDPPAYLATLSGNGAPPPAREPDAPPQTKKRKASDGTFIQVPVDVEPGVTPGWPVDETGKPLNLTDQERADLVAAAFDPEDPTTPPAGEEA